MEYHLTKNTIAQPRYVLDTVCEQAVDIDLTLPDYCPDIERILCCTLIPKIYLANVRSAERRGSLLREDSVPRRRLRRNPFV